MRRVAIAALVPIISFVATSPASAADLMSLNCMAGELDAIQRQKLGHVVGDPVITGRPRDDTGLSPALKAVDSCKLRNAWSDDATDLARAIFLARLARPVIEAALTSDRVSIVAVGRLYRGLPESVRRRFSSRSASDADGVLVVQALTAARIKSTPVIRKRVGMLITLMAIEEFWPPAFAAA